MATAEATTLQEGIKLVERVGCTSVIMESDSLELVQAFNGIAPVFSPYSTILAECFQLAQRIGPTSLHHCNREENLVVHNLARHPVTNSSVFNDNPSSFIVSDVINDVTLFKFQ